MKFLMPLLFLYAGWAQSETLELAGVEYLKPKESASCGLLRQREIERQKVIRELDHLGKLAIKGQGRALLQTGNLLTNKMFMPDDAWRDLNFQVTVFAKMSPAMVQEVRKDGADLLYFSIHGPGVVWQSYAYQVPSELEIEVDLTAQRLRISYPTYLNVLCSTPLSAPVVEWIPTADAPTQPNSGDLINEALAARRP